jgi:hypothetical protein
MMIFICETLLTRAHMSGSAAAAAGGGAGILVALVVMTGIALGCIAIAGWWSYDDSATYFRFTRITAESLAGCSAITKDPTPVLREVKPKKAIEEAIKDETVKYVLFDKSGLFKDDALLFTSASVCTFTFPEDPDDYVLFRKLW